MPQFFQLLPSGVELLLGGDNQLIFPQPTDYLSQPAFFVGNLKVDFL
jgi:hypothetical protein